MQRLLTVVLWTRIALLAIGAGLAAFWLIARIREWAEWHVWMQGISDRAWSATLWTVTAGVAVAFGVLLARRIGSVTPVRTALWIEERLSTGYALVTWVEQAASRVPPSAWLADRVAAAVTPSLAMASAGLPKFARLQLVGPVAFVAGMLAVLLAGPALTTSGIATRINTGFAGTSGAAVNDLPLGAWLVRVTPPAYTGQRSDTVGNVSALVALSGTVIEVIGRDAAPDSVQLRVVRDSAPQPQRVAVHADKAMWRVPFTAVAYPQELRVLRGSHARLLLVEGVADSLPRVTLAQPSRDSVLRVASGRVPLAAVVHDDLGLLRATFEVVVSSGEGEQFTVRTLIMGAREYERTRAVVRTDTIRGVIDFGALNLKAGDFVHVRAVARDRHPLASREMGVSETRAFRIARPSEYDSVAVEPAPPPAVDSSLLSQRMLLMLTERLEQRRPKLPLATLQDESRKLARDQGRLRQAVGDAVFQRLTGEAGGEHSHFAGDGHEHGVEELGGKLGLSGVNDQGMLEEGDDSPVLAINKPLLEAYNAMWDAGRALEQSDTRGAIPFMRLALAAIERARSAQRLYLRGRPPTVIVDINKVRMTGKDTGTSTVRPVRPALPNFMAAKEARLLRAGALLQRDVFAARDSFAVLRLESLQDAPVFALALASLVHSIDSATPRNSAATSAVAPPVDLTGALLHARRVLGTMNRIPPGVWSRGGPPP